MTGEQNKEKEIVVQSPKCRPTTRYSSKPNTNVTNLVEDKRSIARTQYSINVKLQELDKLETAVKTSEEKLEFAEKMLQRDEARFNVFMTEFMKDNSLEESMSNRNKNDLERLKESTKSKVRLTKLETNCLQEEIWKLEEVVKDQLEMKDLVHKIKNTVGRDPETKSEDHSQDSTIDKESELNEIDVLSVGVSLMTLEESNFKLMNDIQDRDRKLGDIQKEIKKFAQLKDDC